MRMLSRAFGLVYDPFQDDASVSSARCANRRPYVSLSRQNSAKYDCVRPRPVDLGPQLTFRFESRSACRSNERTSRGSRQYLGCHRS
jgi:hypothetical protein